jgi:hypothetical protein
LLQNGFTIKDLPGIKTGHTAQANVHEPVGIYNGRDDRICERVGINDWRGFLPDTRTASYDGPNGTLYLAHVKYRSQSIVHARMISTGREPILSPFVLG